MNEISNKYGYKIDFPAYVDPFDVLEACGAGFNFEQVVQYVKELVWRNEQGCSQAMRDD